MQLRCIGKLDEENPVAGNGADRVQRRALGEQVKAVENESGRGVRGAADDLPGVAIVAYVPAPGERLVADAQPTLRRPFAQFA
jgi:hypothetical protein